MHIIFPPDDVPGIMLEECVRVGITRRKSYSDSGGMENQLWLVIKYGCRQLHIWICI